jgi:hypothetical protein
MDCADKVVGRRSVSPMSTGRPLPGSSDDYEMRARLRRLVVRGGVAENPDEARLAVELAHEELLKLPGRFRLMLTGGLVFLALGLVQIAWGDSMTGALSLVVALAAMVGSYLVQRILGARLQRAVRLNEARHHPS